MKSIIQSEKECFVCKTTYGLHEHHIFEGTGRRKQSEKYGMKIWLCGRHHNLSNEGVHFNKELDLRIKRIAQKKFEETYKDLDFIKIFGRNFIM